MFKHGEEISRRRILEEIESRFGAGSQNVFADLDESGDDVARNIREINDNIRIREEMLDDPSIRPSPYKRFFASLKDGAVADLLEDSRVRTGGFAVAALIAGSFLYQHSKKKDRSIDDLTGPPLLPGGSPYESLAPGGQDFYEGLSEQGRPYGGAPSRDQVLRSLQSQGYSSGVQYRVNTTGSMNDLNKLRGLFGGMVNGPVDSTMYSGLDRLGQDPYRQVGSSF